MTTLGLETAEAIGGAAVWDDGGLVGEAALDLPLQHAERLLPMVEKLLADCGLSKGALRRIAVNRGPGSYTGLRIGLATAKGLCQALRIPLVGIDGTDAYRARAETSDRVCVVIHARRDRYYVQRFSEARPLAAVKLRTGDELVRRLSTARSAETIIGSGVSRLSESLEELAIRTQGRVRLGPRALWQPSAAAIARLGHESTEGDGLYALEPHYVEPVLATAA
ncbi:MAG: tRNA (adenosine(37)-N6)-threonylcarbamoyltransferase complex dimerization subunit type 1 TsaB [Candidatus Bipolaricaulota bacterium]|nr:MAG: tRNA (adenosine(37)-N6)-threonylcarbamoyltransferase complex dimerization subunit type 1 TsaB [Candidatus Bipolaricaulota bacterium]